MAGVWTATVDVAANSSASSSDRNTYIGASGNLQFLYENRLQKITENILGSAAASVTFNGIPGTYRGLRLAYQARGDTSATNTSFLVRFNGDTGSNYDSHLADVSGTSTWASAENAPNVSMQLGVISAATAPASVPGQGWLEVWNYAGVTFQKTVNAQTVYKLANSTGNIQHGIAGGHWRNSAAITSITVYPGAGNFATGSLFVLYGYN